MSCQLHFTSGQTENPLLGGTVLPASLSNFTETDNWKGGRLSYFFYIALLRLINRKELGYAIKGKLLESHFGLSANFSGLNKLWLMDKWVSLEESLTSLDFLTSYFGQGDFYVSSSEWSFSGLKGHSLDSFHSFLVARLAQINGCALNLDDYELPLNHTDTHHYNLKWLQHIWLYPHKYDWCYCPEAIYTFGLATRLKAVGEKPLSDQLEPAHYQLLFQECERLLKRKCVVNKEQENNIYLYKTIQEIAHTHQRDAFGRLAKACLLNVPAYAGQVQKIKCECFSDNTKPCPICGNFREVVQSTGVSKIWQLIKNKK